MAELNAQEQVFVDEYLKTLKPYEAAIEAGYAESTAKSKAFTWVSDGKCPKNKLHVLEAVKAAKVERSERTKIDADYVLKRLVEIDEMDVADLLDNVGNIKPVHQWPKVWRTTISGFDLQELNVGDTETILRKIKWPDKVKNLELLGKHVDVGAFRQLVDHGIQRDNPLADLIEAISGKTLDPK